MSIQLGVTQWNIDAHGFEAIARANALGFDAIQIDTGQWEGSPDLRDPEVRREYLRLSQQYGVSLVGLAPNLLNGFSLTETSDQSEYQKAVESLYISIDAAADMNIPVIFVPSFNASEMKSQSDLVNTAAVLRDACDAAQKHGIIISSENTVSAQENLQLVQLVNRPNFRIFLDTLNPALFGHPVPGIAETIKDHLCDQVHLKDGDTLKGNGALGTGRADIVPTLDILREMPGISVLILENDYSVDAEAKVQKDKTFVESFFK